MAISILGRTNQQDKSFRSATLCAHSTKNWQEISFERKGRFACLFTRNAGKTRFCVKIKFGVVSNL